MLNIQCSFKILRMWSRQVQKIFSTRNILFLLLFTIVSGQRESCFRKSRPLGEPANCPNFSRYRLISGRCNNNRNSEWGSAGSTLRRFAPNAYSDGRGEPRGGRHPSSLPSPRWVSQKNHPDNDVPDARFTHMVMQFGQFLDHDITLTPKDEETDCCARGVQGPECFTVPIPSPDRFFSWVNNTAKCLNFVRSIPVCRSIPREQYNEISSFVDASNVYGSDGEHAALLRTYRDGKMHRNSVNDQLPTREQLGLRPNKRLQRPEKPEDFMAGDMRVNEHPFLATLHVIFVREHNRIAKLLKEYLPSNYHQDEILFQESRRLVVAEMQNIVYGEYLPTVLGVDFMRRYDLIVKENTDYDPNADPSIFNAFATAAFRFGHSMINGMFKLVSQRKTSRNKDVYWLWRLREVFDGQSIRGARLPLENMIEGLVTQEPQTCDSFFSTEVTDHLFQKNHLRQNFGEDLLSLNIQRGRDHGLPGYNRYRKSCGLRPISGWTERPSEVNKAYWKKLQDAYDSVDDIDLYVGAIGEDNVNGGVVGPTFACLIGEQFSRIKKGDKYFYTHSTRRGGQGLGPIAKKEVLKRTLGDVLCGVLRMDQIQKWVTLQPNNDYNQYESCSSKATLNMRSIAQEISRELNAQAAKTATSRRPTLVSGGPPSRNSLLQVGPLRFSQNDAVSRPLPQENRIRANFEFPGEVSRSTGRSRPQSSNRSLRNRLKKEKDARIRGRNNLPRPTVQNNRPLPTSRGKRFQNIPPILGRTRGNQILSQQRSSQETIQNRLNPSQRFGISSRACLFQIC